MYYSCFLNEFVSLFGGRGINSHKGKTARRRQVWGKQELVAGTCRDLCRCSEQRFVSAGRVGCVQVRR